MCLPFCLSISSFLCVALLSSFSASNLCWLWIFSKHERRVFLLVRQRFLFLTLSFHFVLSCSASVIGRRFKRWCKPKQYCFRFLPSISPALILLSLFLGCFFLDHCLVKLLFIALIFMSSDTDLSGLMIDLFPSLPPFLLPPCCSRSLLSLCSLISMFFLRFFIRFRFSADFCCLDSKSRTEVFQEPSRRGESKRYQR